MFESMIAGLIFEVALIALGIYLVGVGSGMLIERYRIKGNLKP
jgi:hypothetical protein